MTEPSPNEPSNSQAPATVLFDRPYWKDPESCILGVAAGILGIGTGAWLACTLWAWDYSDMAAPWMVRSMVAACAIGVTAYGLSCVYRVFGRITVDEDGVTYTNIGRHVRIGFNEVTGSWRKWNQAILIESERHRIVCDATKRTLPCAEYLDDRLDGLCRQRMLNEPWRFDPEELAAYCDTQEFRHSRLLLAGTLLFGLMCIAGGLAGFYGILFTDESLGSPYGLAVLSAILLLFGALFVYLAYLMSEKIRVDDTGISQSRLGRTTRIDFDAVDRAEMGQGIRDGSIRLHAGGKSIRVSQMIGNGTFLLHLLFERVPALGAHGHVELPYTVHASRVPFAGVGLLVLGLLGIAAACVFAPGEEGWIVRIAVPVFCVAMIPVTLVLAFKIPARAVFDSESVTIEYLRSSRVFDVSQFSDIRPENPDKVVLVFQQQKVEILTRDVATSLLVRILRNLYADQLRTAPTEKDQ
jgi:hypothetical protein